MLPSIEAIKRMPTQVLPELEYRVQEELAKCINSSYVKPEPVGVPRKAT